MTTPLPSRLRESAKALRGLSPCSEHSYEVLDVVAWNIAAELTEAADALEARPRRWIERWYGSGPDRGWWVWEADHGARIAYCGEGGFAERLCSLIVQKHNDADPAAQVAQEGAAGVATRHPRCGYPYCACVGQCFAASQPGAADGVKGRR